MHTDIFERESFTAHEGSKFDTYDWSSSQSGGYIPTVESNQLAIKSGWYTGGKTAIHSKRTGDDFNSFLYSFDTVDSATRSTLYFDVASSTSGKYTAEVPSDSTTGTLTKTVSGTRTVLGTFPLATPTADADRYIHMKTEGDEIIVYAEDAEDGLNLTATSSSLTVADTEVTNPGKSSIEFVNNNGKNTVRVDDFISVNTVAAPSYANYTYDADGRVLTETLPNGNRTWGYANGKLTTYQQTAPGNSVNDTMTYNTAGYLANKNGASLQYDQAGQLTGRHTNETWSYDTAGRRSSYFKAGKGTTNYTYNNASQLTTITPTTGNPTTITYDNAGRRTAENTGTDSTTYQYDPLGRLETLDRTIGTKSTNQQRVHNAKGQPIAILNIDQNNDYDATRIDWDHSQLGNITGWQTNGTTTNFPTTPVGHSQSKTGNDLQIVSQDHQGTARNVWANLITAGKWYGQYGDVVSPATTTGKTSLNPRLGYRGELTFGDHTHLRARQYDAKTGLFTTVDPLNDVPTAPTVGNTYHYTNNNPINVTDKTGLTPDDGDIDKEFGDLLYEDPCNPLLWGYMQVGGACELGFTGTAELDFCTGLNTYDCFKVQQIYKPQAYREAGERFGKDATVEIYGQSYDIPKSHAEGNAFQHMAIAGLLYFEFGYERAKGFLDRHETLYDTHRTNRR